MATKQNLTPHRWREKKGLFEEQKPKLPRWIAIGEGSSQGVPILMLIGLPKYERLNW
jgi:hypothetical protein